MAWVARNNGLTGTALNVNYIAQHPAFRHLPFPSNEVLIATNGGVFRTTTGGLSWAQFTLPDPSNAEFVDDPAATVDELTFHWVGFDPLVLNTIYVLAAKNSVQRIWLYRSTNVGGSWISRGITTT